jgi:hypothetical protein
MQTELTHKYLKMGVPSRQERVDFITKESEEWGQDDEDEITSAEYFITDNQETYDQMMIPEQKAEMKKMLDEARVTIYKKKSDREAKIGTVAETKAETHANSFHIYHSFHKDSEFKEKLWSREAFEDMEDWELGKWVVAYNVTTGNFGNKNFKKIAAMPFVLNLISYCKDQGMFFYGKPITELTTYQLAIYTKAMRNSFTLRETKSKHGSPEINNDLKMRDLIEWYDHEYTMIIAESQSSK